MKCIYEVDITLQQAEFIGLALIRAKGNDGQRIEVQNANGEILRLNIKKSEEEKAIELKPSCDLSNPVIKI